MSKIAMSAGVHQEDRVMSTLQSPRGKEIEGLISKTSDKVGKTLDIPTKIDRSYDYLIRDDMLVAIFERFPTLWYDVQQKIRRHISTPEGRRESTEAFEARMIAAFLIPVQYQVGISLSPEEYAHKIRQGIIKNKQLSQYVEKNTPHSFLEYPTGKLKKMNPRQLEHLFKETIVRNTGRPGNELKDFNGIFRSILRYAKEIFSVDFESVFPSFRGVATFMDLDTPADTIYRGLQSRHGRKSSLAAMFLRAIYAWGDLKEIENAYDRAVAAQETIFTSLQKLSGWEGLNPDDVISSSRDPRKAMRFLVPLSSGHHVRVTIESGVKSVRSVLVKLFSDENFNNVDAVNDLLGIRVFLHDVAPEDRNECIAWFSRFMGKNAYMFTDKDLVSHEDLNVLGALWGSGESGSPAYLGKKPRKKKSSSKYRDAKYSGFLAPEFSEKPSGAEIQFFDTTDDPNPSGEAHHSILDAAKIIQGWNRGEKFITARQALLVIRKECIRDGRSRSGLEVEEVFGTLIDRGMLVPYLIGDPKDPQSVVFATYEYELELQDMIPSAVRYDFGHGKNHQNRKNLDRYIEKVITLEV